jgi:hypothetical protein
MAAGAGGVNPACSRAMRILALTGMNDQQRDKERRLAEALRANLRRRKAQSRESDPPVEPKAGD